MYQGTLDEEDLKLMSPPLSDEELENLVGSLWLPVPRRGIKQKGKCRLIDDYTAYHVNALVTTLNKLDLMGVDEVTGLVRAWQLLADSTSLHKDWSKGEVKKMVGSTLDLKAAYKNFAAKPLQEDSRKEDRICAGIRGSGKCIVREPSIPSSSRNTTAAAMGALRQYLRRLPHSGARGHRCAWRGDG